MLLFLFSLVFQILLSSSAEDTLLVAQAIFRHGARAPMGSFSSPEAEKYFYRGLDELSDAGVKQAIELGNSLKKRLVDSNFLDIRYIPSENSFYSSPRLRCLMTASAVGSSMFSSEETAIPVAVLTENDENNICLPPSPPLVMKELLKHAGLQPSSNVCDADDIFLLMLDSYLETAIYLKNSTIAYLAASIMDEMDNGLPAPEWFNEDIEKETRELIYKGMSFVTGTGEYFNENVIRCRSGLLLNTIMENMKKNINCTGKCVKFYSYATHDTMVQPLLGSLGVLERALRGRVSPPSSAILIELWKPEQEKEEPYVKVLWRVPGAEFVSLSQNITGCNPIGNCPFSLFISSISKYSTSQPSIDCAVDNAGGKTRSTIVATFFISLYLAVFYS